MDDYLTFAAEAARAAFTPPTSPKVLDTHFVDYDAPQLGHGRVRAICGAIVHEPTQHALEPSCLECQQIQIRLDGIAF